VGAQPTPRSAPRPPHPPRRPPPRRAGAPGGLRDGTVTNHLVNWLTPVKERVTAVTGERGTFVADMLSADLTFHTNGYVPTSWEALENFQGVSQGDTITYAIPKPEPLAVELQAFRDAVFGKGKAIVTLEEGLAALIVAEACLESATTGTTVELPHT
jgi:UDP-N-acetylglucosamine 3-dehydrogenase